MWSESSKLALLRAHLFNDFNYATDTSLRYWSKSRPGPSMKLLRRGPEMRDEQFKKIVIFDFDGVFNRYQTPSPAELYLGYLIEKNPHLREKKDRVIHSFRMLEKADDPRLHAEELSYDFRKGGLSRSLHNEACEYAARKFDLVANYRTALKDMRDMAYRPFILSASPEGVIASSSSRLSIKMSDVEATKFYFDSHGIFSGMELNLDDTRSARRDKIMESQLSTKYGVEIMVDDNPITGRRIAKPGWKHVYLWLNDTTISDNVSVVAKGARTDFSKVVEMIRKLERGLAILIKMNERLYKSAVNMSHMVMDYGQRALQSSGPEFEVYKTQMGTSLTRYVRDMSELYPTKRTEILNSLGKIRAERNEGEAKSMIGDLTKKFYADSLEAKISADLIV